MILVLAVYHIFKREWKQIKSALLVLVLSFLPACLNVLFEIKLDIVSSILYYAILFMTLYLGSSIHFYDKFSWWDRLVHFLSGVAFVGFGIALTFKSPGTIRPGILLFSFTFSITLHVFWEVLEYVSDCMTHGNAQRWQKRHDSNNHVSENAIQPAGLVDTMNDLICCIVGATLAVFVWWFLL
jgi:hypothetical protein